MSGCWAATLGAVIAMSSLPPASDRFLDSPVLAVKGCPACGETKPLSEFYRDRVRSDGRSTYCRTCDLRRTNASRARRRKQMGEEAWLELQRANQQRRRAKGAPKDRAQREAYRAAESRLREAHREEFESYYRQERYDRGLPI